MAEGWYTRGQGAHFRQLPGDAELIAQELRGGVAEWSVMVDGVIKEYGLLPSLEAAKAAADKAAAAGWE